MPDPLNKPERSYMCETLRALTLPRRKPTEADAPTTSTFPMTRAARAALDLARGKRIT